MVFNFSQPRHASRGEVLGPVMTSKLKQYYIIMASQPTPLTYPPPEIRPYSGLINQDQVWLHVTKTILAHNWVHSYDRISRVIKNQQVVIEVLLGIYSMIYPPGN